MEAVCHLGRDGPVGTGRGRGVPRQLGYRKTLATCNTALEKIEGKTPADTKRITFEELKSKLPPDPVHTKEVHSFAQSEVYTWTWQGIRRYKVRLFVNPKDGAVWDVNSEP